MSLGLKVDLACQRFENARQNAETALALFDQLGAQGAKADAYRVIGTVYRDTGRPALAESRLRSAVELAKDWRTDRILRRLEAMLIVLDKTSTFLLSGNGDLIEPDDGIVGIGSGGPFALAAARALAANTDLDARAIAEKSMVIAADICVYTNSNIVVEEL